MIVGPTFIWLHFPKCAGTEVTSVLRRTFGGDTNIFFDKGMVIHHSVDRQIAVDDAFDPSDKEIICGFRRLPYWLISKIHYDYARAGVFPTREMLSKDQFFEWNRTPHTADDYAKIYTERRVSDWIRFENIEEDFRCAFSRHLDMNKINFETAFNKRNEAETPHIKEIEFYFSRDNLRELYE